MGIPVSGKNIFPSNIQGLPTWYTLRLSKDGYLARVEDDDIVVVNKPAGMVVHPAPGHARGTLVNALLAYSPELASSGDDRPGIVHRLDKDTSGLMECLKYGNVESLLDQFSGTGQTCRTAADNCHAFSVGFFDFRDFHQIVFPFVISCEPFKVADCDRVAFFSENATDFTLFLLRADTSAYRGKRIGLFQLLCSTNKVTFGNKADELRNFHIHRATRDTKRFFTLQAAQRLRFRFLLRQGAQAEGDVVEDGEIAQQMDLLEEKVQKRTRNLNELNRELTRAKEKAEVVFHAGCRFSYDQDLSPTARTALGWPICRAISP